MGEPSTRIAPPCAPELRSLASSFAALAVVRSGPAALSDWGGARRNDVEDPVDNRTSDSKERHSVAIREPECG